MPVARVTPRALAKKHLDLIDADAERLGKVDDYIKGDHDLPYMPETADNEYRLLANRAISNWSPLLVGTIAQALYVDGYRPGAVDGKKKDARGGVTTRSEQWTFWQRNRMDGRQSALYRSSCGFGQAFLAVTRDAKGKAKAKMYSALHSSALWEDPANDEFPYSFLTIESYPEPGEKAKGIAHMWVGPLQYKVRFESSENLTVGKGFEHGTADTPVVRFAPYVGLEGEVLGLVEPLIPLQDRLNQTVFDLLVAQTYSSFKVRWASGMAPPVQMESVEVDDGEGGTKTIWKPKIDPATGKPMPKPININSKRMLIAEKPDAKFGTLDETPLGGFIESIDMSIRHLSAIAQIPPHHLLGQIANLSAEALQAAETSLSRKIEEFRKTFGESWERVFRLASEVEGVEGADDYHGEVVWRDVEVRSLSQTADGLGKFAEALEIPKRGLWPRVPGVSQDELDLWGDLYEQDTAIDRAAERLANTTSRRRSAASTEPVDGSSESAA